MRDRLFLGWWILFLLWCCVDLCWSVVDVHKHSWFELAIDGPFTVVFFFAAHFSWEKEYYG